MIKDVSVEIIQKCPNNCMHCSSCSSPESTYILDVNTIKKLVSDFSNMGVKRVCLSGGEPFLHPDLINIVEFVSQSDATVDVYSCGITLGENGDKEIDLQTLSQLKLAGLNRIMFNLPSVEETKYNQITGSFSHYPMVMQSIRNAISIGLETEIHFVPMKINKDDIDEIVNFALQEKIDQVSFLKLVPHGRAKEHLAQLALNDKENKIIQDRLYNLKNEGAPIRIGLPFSKGETLAKCHAVNDKLYIKYDGTVYGCEAFKYIDFSKHDLKIMPNSIIEMCIKDVFEQSLHLKQSAELVTKYSTLEVGCENCPVQKYLIDIGGQYSGMGN